MNKVPKRGGDELPKTTIPTHRPAKRSALAHLLKQARLDVDDL